MAKKEFVSGLPGVIPQALDHPPKKSLEEAIERARQLKRAKPYRRTKAQIAVAKRVTDRMLGEGRDD